MEELIEINSARPLESSSGGSSAGMYSGTTLGGPLGTSLGFSIPDSPPGTPKRISPATLELNISSWESFVHYHYLLGNSKSPVLLRFEDVIVGNTKLLELKKRILTDIAPIRPTSKLITDENILRTSPEMMEGLHEAGFQISEWNGRIITIDRMIKDIETEFAEYLKLFPGWEYTKRLSTIYVHENDPRQRVFLESISERLYSDYSGVLAPPMIFYVPKYIRD